MNCENCKFYETDLEEAPCIICERNYDDMFEYKNAEFKGIEVDTKVLVSNDGKSWQRAYFAGLINGQLFAWDGGKTSYTTTEKVAWEYMQCPLE